jgi:hypothetical protein
MYLAGEPDDARLEFAPRGHQRAGPIERLAADLRSSDAQVLAIDTERPAETPPDLVAAERDLERARERRRRLERRRLGRLPERREQLDAARRQEASAVAAVRRLRVELDHGALPFVDEHELEARLDRLRELARDRADERVLRRSRGLRGAGARSPAPRSWNADPSIVWAKRPRVAEHRRGGPCRRPATEQRASGHVVAQVRQRREPRRSDG